MMTMTDLVMLPGTLCDKALFAGQIRSLPVNVHVGDLTKSDTIEGMALDVLRAAPERFALAGLSLGGIVAAEIVRVAPERVVGLALLDTNLNAPSPEQLRDRSVWEADVRAGHFATLVAENFLIPLTAHPDVHSETIFAMAMRVGPTAFLRQNAALVQRLDRRHILNGLDIPVLIACGCFDTITPTALHEELVKRCSRGHLAVVPDTGHLSTIDQPAALTQVLSRWLQTCDNNLQEGPGHEFNFA